MKPCTEAEETQENKSQGSFAEDAEETEDNSAKQKPEQS